MEIRRLLSAVVLSVALCCPALAQDVLRVPVDGIAAIVGDTPIPMSRIDEQLQTYRSQGGEIPTEPEMLAVLRRQLLESVIDDELLVQAAERDTMVVVTDEDVQGVVDEAIQQIRDAFNSQEDLERDLHRRHIALRQPRSALDVNIDPARKPAYWRADDRSAATLL